MLLLEAALHWSNPPFLIFDIWVFWCSVLSPRVPKCQKLNMMCYTSTTKCKALMGSAVKGLRIGRHCHCLINNVKVIKSFISRGIYAKPFCSIMDKKTRKSLKQEGTNQIDSIHNSSPNLKTLTSKFNQFLLS